MPELGDMQGKWRGRDSSRDIKEVTFMRLGYWLAVEGKKM
jgi:hypothetical protein